MAQVAGVVLAGGGGRRLGADKALVRLAGATLAERAVAALRIAGAAPVLVVGGEPARLHRLGLDAIADPPPGGEGPLAGLVAGLSASPSWFDAVITLPVDTAEPDPDVLRELVARLVADGADAAIARSGGRLHWTTAAWAPAASVALGTAFAAGTRSLHGGVATLDRVVAVDVEPAVVADIDTPDDLAAAVDRSDRAAPVDHTGAPTPVASGPRRGAARTRVAERCDVEVPDIDIDELDRARGAGPVVLVDVRQPDEFTTARVPGAVLIPLGELADRVGEIPADGVVHVICHSGARSHAAAAFLRQAGLDAVNVAGGTAAWLESGREHHSGPTP
ncbi:MAG TPA: NTP transferase domain-containing protein [Acidimicrobiales bacterium]|nr:NTP transferase domain-containing protein [Acidimicrobiales bacterium]